MKIKIIIICFCFLSNSCIGQVEIVPRIALNSINYDLDQWNNVTDSSKILIPCLGLEGRLKLSSRLNFVMGFDFYLSDKIFHADYITTFSSIGFNFFDLKIGAEVQLYDNTFLGLGIETEQLLNIRRFDKNNPQIPRTIFDNKRHFGLDLSIRQKFNKIEVFGSVYINVYSKFEFPIATKSHNKFQLGFGVPITLK